MFRVADVTFLHLRRPFRSALVYFFDTLAMVRVEKQKLSMQRDVPAMVPWAESREPG